jgi:hypothetical protein
MIMPIMPYEKNDKMPGWCYFEKHRSAGRTQYGGRWAVRNGRALPGRTRLLKSDVSFINKKKGIGRFYPTFFYCPYAFD